MKNLKTGCLILFVIAIIGSIFGKSSTTTPQKQITNYADSVEGIISDNEVKGEVACEEAVENSVLSPSSLHWVFGSTNTAEIPINDPTVKHIQKEKHSYGWKRAYLISKQFDASNAFGAILRKQVICFVQAKDTTIELTDFEIK